MLSTELHDAHVQAWETHAERESIQDGDATPLWTDGERAAYGAGLIAASAAKARAAEAVGDTLEYEFAHDLGELGDEADESVERTLTRGAMGAIYGDSNCGKT